MKKELIALCVILGIFSLSLGSASIAYTYPPTVYCENMGYTPNDTDCIFPDNKSCELDSFYKNTCGKEYVKELPCIKNDELQIGHKCCPGFIPVTIGGEDPFESCRPCGDGICEGLENNHNCPADCTNGSCKPVYDFKDYSSYGFPSYKVCTLTSSCDPFLGKDYFKILNECEIALEKINSTVTCESLYWFDFSNLICRHKDFCDDYYKKDINLRTFNTQDECEKVLNEEKKYLENSTTSACKTFYYFNNESKECRERSFCWNYTEGLQTFESKAQCEKALNYSLECTTNEDCYVPCFCGDPSSEKECRCPQPGISCVNRKCKEMKTCPKNSGDENGKCMFNLSNGRKAEIKIMPETASQNAIDKLGELGFTVELKEVGKGDKAKAVYELTGNKQGKFLGIFKIMARVQAQVDAGTGDVKVIKPWWSFLASGI